MVFTWRQKKKEMSDGEMRRRLEGGSIMRRAGRGDWLGRAEQCEAKGFICLLSWRRRGACVFN